MNKYHNISEPQDASASAHSSAPAGNDRKNYIAGKVLPLAVWIFFLVLILISMIADARRMLYEGASLDSLLVLARVGLTGAFMVLLVTAYLTRIRATERAQGFLQRSFPLLVFVVSIIGIGLVQSRPGSPPFYLVAPGLVLGPLGLCLSLWSVWHLRSSFSILAEARRTVVSGPYRYVRHPLYLGEALTLLGACLLIGTGIALLFWAVVTGLQLARARIEEKKLSRALSDYQAYRGKTPFIFPGFLIRPR
jgi:protein-S-isoprenylcysteine O-methyltransferase Ste14